MRATRRGKLKNKRPATRGRKALGRTKEQPFVLQRLILPSFPPADPADPRSQEEAAEAIRWHEAAFAHSNNPLYAWFAYHQACVAGLDVPERVSAYVASTAAKIWLIAWQMACHPSNGGKPAARIFEALGMKRLGRGTVFSEFRAAEPQLILAAYVYAHARGHGKPYLEWQNVANRHGVDSSTVRRAWNKYKHIFPPLAPAPEPPEPKAHDE